MRFELTDLSLFRHVVEAGRITRGMRARLSSFEGSSVTDGRYSHAAPSPVQPAVPWMCRRRQQPVAQRYAEFTDYFSPVRPAQPFKQTTHAPVASPSHLTEPGTQPAVSSLSADELRCDCSRGKTRIGTVRSATAADAREQQLARVGSSVQPRRSPASR